MFEDGLLTLAGVQAGLGCALMREPLIAPYLESGELVKIFDLPIDDGRDYYLCVRSDSEMTEDGKLLQNWLRRAAGESSRVKGDKKASCSAGFWRQDLELVGQTQRNDVVGTDACLASELVVIEQVDFVIHVGGHVFVKIVGRANIDVFNQILVAEVFDVFTFGLQVSDGWTQAKVELILSHNFEVLRLVCKTVNVGTVVRGTETGCIVGLRVLCREVNVVRVVFHTTAVYFCAVAFTVYASRILVSGTTGGGHCTTYAEAFAQIVSQGCAIAVTVLVQQAAAAGVFTYAAVFTLILQSKVQAVNQTKEVLLR
jgi:hypothetical protein